jgi:hypothetical protein
MSILVCQGHQHTCSCDITCLPLDRSELEFGPLRFRRRSIGPKPSRAGQEHLLKNRTSTFRLCALQATASLASRPRQPRRARRTVVAPPLAISSIGAFRTPAVGACG